MRLYFLYSGTVTKVTYQLGTNGTEVTPAMVTVDGVSAIEVPDDVVMSSNLNAYLYVTVNDTIRIPVCYSTGIFLDDVDVDKYVADNTYVAYVNPKASKIVKYKDLYKILERITNGTITRIHNILGY